MKSLKKIKDPLHGYIYLSSLEQRLLEHPLILRLHHVRQNGCAFLVYPSLRVHRFEHSLGAMHIAGLMFSHAMRFSDDQNFKSKLYSLIKSIGIDIDGYKSALQRNLSTNEFERFITNDGLYILHDLNIIDTNDQFASLLAFQSTRIAALVHDIGHPPFSHTFETTLKQLAAHQYRSHEVIGIELLKKIVEEMKLNKLYPRGEHDLASACVDIASIILDKTAPSHSLLDGLSKIVASDVDADRLDYVRRDALAAGVTSNSYDLGRLLDSIRLDITEPEAGERAILELNWTPQALSTMEAFFGVRFHLYRWTLWHHAVVRQNLALILITSGLWKLREWNLDYLQPINGIISEIFDIATNEQRRGEYWYFTDHYLMKTLTDIYVYLDANADTHNKNPKGWVARPNQRGHNKAEWGLIADVHKFLKTFLHREKGWLVPLWKRPDKHEEFARKVMKLDKDNAAEFNNKVKLLFETIVIREGRQLKKDISSLENLDKFRRDYVDYLTGQFNEYLSDRINAILKNAGYRCKLRAYYIAKFSPAPTDMRFTSDGGQIELKVLSPTIASLQQAWESLPHLWLFWEFYAFEDSGEKVEKIEEVRATVRERGADSVVADVLRELLDGAQSGAPL